MSTRSSESIFDNAAARYDEQLEQGLSVTGEHKEYYAAGRVQCLLELIGAKRAIHRVVDFGCGVGSTLTVLRACYPEAEMVGVDSSQRSLDIARTTVPRAIFLSPDEFKAASDFDLCYCNGVFHHIPPGERHAYARLIAERLRAGGRFALFENNPLNPGTRLVMSRIPFDRDAMTLTPWESIRMLKGAGLEVVMVRYLFFFPRALAVLRPLEGCLSRIPLGGQYLVIGRRPV